MLRGPILPRSNWSRPSIKPCSIGFFDVSASSENAHKNSLLTNGLSATQGKDPKFCRSRRCDEAAAALFSEHQQYAAHSAVVEKFFATRQSVASRAAQQKRNTCDPITSVDAHA
jgi:hypothetical protein